MGELLNGASQLQILRAMAEDYPAASEIEASFGEMPSNQLNVNLTYLHEHGLIHCEWYPVIGDVAPLPENGKITAHGLDFLADDGGLSAILGVVTVRFDDVTLKAMLSDKIESADGDPDVKVQMLAAVKSMPAEALKTLSQKAIEYGLAAAPTGLIALKTHLGL
jgi:hypothetical protein